MEPNIHLFIHNIFSGLSTLVLFIIAFFLLSNKNKTTAGITIALTALSAGVFIASHFIGISVGDSELSKNILMLNLSNFLIIAFNVHSVLAAVKKDKKYKWLIIFVYAFSLIMIVFLSLNKDLFLLDSVPKMYFPNYYVPGTLHWIRIVFMFALCLPYLLYLLVVAYRSSTTPEEKNRFKYFLLVMVSGYGIGFVPNLLVYNIEIDPLWGVAFAVVLAIPFALGAIKHELFNIKVIAKQAIWYSFAIVIVGGIIVLLNYSNQLTQNLYPSFPTWIIPIISSILVVTIGVIVWKRLKENDLLKYEFITTMTHKLRTPLTGIKWATENLSRVDLPDSVKTQIGYIKSENARLVELTNLLMNVSRAEDSSYGYQIKKNNISAIAEEVIFTLSEQMKAKNISAEKKFKQEINALFDAERTKFVLQVFLENAIHYTLQGGKITISVFEKDNSVIFSVKDTGVGISKNDFGRLFNKFYRGDKARLADTEGVGVGLFISKEIISRQDGKIWAESDGEGKGSTFSFSLPMAK